MILVTGAAGFIGFNICKKLLKEHQVIGIDNLNEYYDVNLKKSRLKQLKKNKNFTFYQYDITNKEQIFSLQNEKITHVLNLAAQAGVRYSLTNPFVYGETNIIGHLTILELCRKLKNLENFVYASSSSVYGANTKLPFSVEDRVDSPISLYAATKRSTELMSYNYNHLFGIPMTGLRFFTVYGPWGRPDMSAFIFTKAIIEENPLPLFNGGNMKRNFTYVDDIVDGAIASLFHINKNHTVYNIGNNKAEHLMDYINTLEKIIGKKAILDLLPMQPGDVKETIADIEKTTKDLNFTPKTSIEEGLTNFVAWYKKYYNISEVITT